jgi:membrane protein DedA with SNARE-associated domain
VVLFARFVVVLRQLNGIVAGTMGMNWWRFVVYNSLGAALWVGFWGGLAYWLGRRFKEVLKAESIAQPYLIAGAVAAVAIGLGYYFLVYRRRTKKPKRAARRK